MSPKTIAVAIAYPGADSEDSGRLVVVKSSILRSTPRRFVEYRRTRDPAFPHHSTARQWFDRERIEMYRALGDQQASEALAVSGK